MRKATCRCGALVLECEGDPVRISVCHCLECQRRTGSVFSAQARFPADRVRLSGERRRYERIADSGRRAIYSFCPGCGSTVAYENEAYEGLIAVPIGAFADPGFPPPAFSVWERRRHGWVEIGGDRVEHQD